MNFTKIIVILVMIIVVILAFEGGLAVGYHRGSFSYAWHSAYQETLGGPPSIFAPLFRDSDDPNPHGAVGNIVKVSWPEFMIKGPGSAEQIVAVSPTTTIRFLRGNAASSSLVVGASVLVIGKPNDQGVIDASFVRIIGLENTATSSTVK